MKTILKFAFTAVLALFLGKAMAGDQILTVAVLDFDSSDGPDQHLGSQVATLLDASLSAEPQIITVERADLDKVLVTGRVFMAGDQLILVAKTIGTETSRVYGEMVSGPADAPITDLSAELAKKIAADVVSKGDTLIAAVKSRDDVVAQIKKELGSQKLPAVSVKIPEQYFGQFVIDPAAQTELSMILKQCGFTVVDDLSTNRADIEITGEAFSEFGMQKGNLKSCSARIEIKARDTASGNILDIDRQTSVAVGLAEHIAAKTALQNGMDTLAERLVPLLAPQNR